MMRKAGFILLTFAAFGRTPEKLPILGEPTTVLKMVDGKRTQMAREVLHIRKKLATFSGVPIDELMVMRNTTEALDTVILGLDMAPGDQILLATSEYSNMMAPWDMRAKRLKQLIRLPIWTTKYLILALTILEPAFISGQLLHWEPNFYRSTKKISIGSGPCLPTIKKQPTILPNLNKSERLRGQFIWLLKVHWTSTKSSALKEKKGVFRI